MTALLPDRTGPEAPASGPAPGRDLRSRAAALAAPSAAVVAVLVGWELLARGPLDGTVPRASAVARTLGPLLAAGPFWQGLGETVFAAATGLVIAVLVGVPVGVVLGRSAVVFASTRFPFEFLKPIPPIVILPLAVLVLGPSRRMAVALVVFGCFFGIVTQTMSGVRDVDPVALDTARSFRLGAIARLQHVVLPSALPFVATAVRVAGSFALIVAVVSELVGGAPGIGRDLLLAQGAGDTAATYAYVTVFGVLGLAVNRVLAALERRVLHWHPSVRSEVRP